MAKTTFATPLEDHSLKLQASRGHGDYSGMKIVVDHEVTYAMLFRESTPENGVRMLSYPVDYHSLRTILNIIREISFLEPLTKYSISFQTTKSYTKDNTVYRPKLTIAATGEGTIELICSNSPLGEEEENPIVVVVRPKFVVHTDIKETLPFMKNEFIAGWVDAYIAALDHTHFNCR